jgi:hypothetical protein
VVEELQVEDLFDGKQDEGGYAEGKLPLLRTLLLALDRAYRRCDDGRLRRRRIWRIANKKSRPAEPPARMCSIRG